VRHEQICCRLYQADFAGQLEPLRELAALRMRLHGAEDRDTIASSGLLGFVLSRLGQLEEAERIQRQAIESATRLERRTDTPELLKLRNNLANTLSYLGRFADCEAVLRELIADCMRVLGDSHTITLQDEGNLAELQRMQAQFPAALATVDGALARARGRLGATDATWVDLRFKRGRILLGLNDGAAAALELGQLREELLPEIGPAHERVLMIGRFVAQAYELQQDWPAAEREYAAVDAAAAALPGGDWMRWSLRGARGQFLLRRGRYAEAEPLLDEAHARLVELAPKGLECRKLLEERIRLYEATGRATMAEACRAQLGESGAR
jgi:tetratricopeptide (TPR) repeat protein